MYAQTMQALENPRSHMRQWAAKRIACPKQAARHCVLTWLLPARSAVPLVMSGGLAAVSAHFRGSCSGWHARAIDTETHSAAATTTRCCAHQQVVRGGCRHRQPCAKVGGHGSRLTCSKAGAGAQHFVGRYMSPTLNTWQQKQA